MRQKNHSAHIARSDFSLLENEVLKIYNTHIKTTENSSNYPPLLYVVICQFLNTSLTPLARPAIDCISEGIMILVA